MTDSTFCSVSDVWRQFLSDAILFEMGSLNDNG